QSLSCELEKQKMEMDWFLQMENQRLRNSILLEGIRQKEAIIQQYESKVNSLIALKDEQLTLLKSKASELHNSLKTAQSEAVSWKKKAKECEAAVRHLKKKLVKCLGGEEEESIIMACKGCHTRSICFVFLPCRHLCCCSACEPLLGRCPVCRTVKEASLEVLL
ncbi:hypothetical protein M569_08369, partial [Genlisea aurea]